MSLQIGQGGWKREGVLGVGDLFKGGKAIFNRFRGGNGNGGPPMGPGGVYTGNRPGIDRGDFRNLVTPGAGLRTAVPDTMPMGGKVSGYHLNKSSYFLMDGTFVAQGTKWVKDRRRNSLNPAALSRSIARVKGAKTAAKKLSDITIRKTCKK